MWWVGGVSSAPVYQSPPVVEDHEAGSVTDAVVRLHVQLRGLPDVLELAHHQDHTQHAQATGNNTLQNYLRRMSQIAQLYGYTSLLTSLGRLVYSSSASLTKERSVICKINGA